MKKLNRILALSTAVVMIAVLSVTPASAVRVSKGVRDLSRGTSSSTSSSGSSSSGGASYTQSEINNMTPEERSEAWHNADSASKDALHEANVNEVGGSSTYDDTTGSWTSNGGNDGYTSSSSGGGSSGSSSSNPTDKTAELADQMAKNSAAWEIANAAGDTKTADALHQANQELANEMAGSSGSANYDDTTGSWTIKDSNGNTTVSSSTKNNKADTTTFETTDSSGKTIGSTTSTSFTQESIDAYKKASGDSYDPENLKTAYNNVAAELSQTDEYGDDVAKISAAAETAVVKNLLGLSDADAAKLQAELETRKADYVNQQTRYDEAMKTGDLKTAEAAEKEMAAINAETEKYRQEEFGYTGNTSDYADGGYYEGSGQPKPSQSGGGGGGTLNPDIAQTFSITATAGAGGSISPSGTVRVVRGNNQSFSITPQTGYEIANVVVDGTSDGTVPSYHFSNVTAAHTIAATFKKKTYSVIANAGNGGSISPSGEMMVPHGDSKTFSITPRPGFEIKSAVVDGSSVGAISSYTLSTITSSHTVTASFVPSGKVSMRGVSITDLKGNDLLKHGIKSGYGVFASVKGSYSDVDRLTVTATYDFGQGSKTVSLQETSKGVFQFPKNNSSPKKHRCVYIPVETKDGVYSMIFTITGYNALGERLTSQMSTTIQVAGNMHEDDFTSDKR